MTMLRYSALQRDPFARATLMRETDSATRDTCAFCGQSPAKYRYGWDSDGNPRAWRASGRHQFCSVGCWRSFTS